MMNAREVKAKLQADLATHEGALGLLEGERARLALPAHSGDRKAMLRLQDLRPEIADHRASVRDLEQALADIEPALRRQQAAEALEHQRRAREAYDAEMAGAMEAVGRVDGLIDQLAAAAMEAASKVETTRARAVALLVPPNGDPTHLAMNRLIVHDGVGFRSVPELVVTTLKTLLDRGVGEYRSALVSALGETQRSLDARIGDAMTQNALRASVAAATELAA